VALATTSLPASLHATRMLVIDATTSIADEARLVAGLNIVTSPVEAGIATAGHALRVIAMPPVSSMSPSFAHPDKTASTTNVAAIREVTASKGTMQFFL